MKRARDEEKKSHDYKCVKKMCEDEDLVVKANASIRANASKKKEKKTVLQMAAWRGFVDVC